MGAIPETIVSDPTRLKQIVTNLVGNAIKFTESGSIRILVRCDEPDSPAPKLVIDVTDTGIGMTDAQLLSLFQSFSQADASTTRKFGGVRARSAHQQAAGRSSSAETSPWRASPAAEASFASRFRPVPSRAYPWSKGSPRRGSPTPRPRPTRSVPSLPPSCRVLLAEDGHDNQVLVTTYLVKAGATVKVVADGLLAVEEATTALAAGKPYDVILMDMQMPKLDGYGATSKLRLMKYDRPIVALTAHADGGRPGALREGRVATTTSRSRSTAPSSWRWRRALHRPTGGRRKPREHSRGRRGHEGDPSPVRPRCLPDRSSAILRASQASDVETLKRLAHQLQRRGGWIRFSRHHRGRLGGRTRHHRRGRAAFTPTSRRRARESLPPRARAAA